MKELSDVSEKFLMTHHKRHRTRVVKNTIDNTKDSRGIISYPQIVFYKSEKSYKMRFKNSISSDEYSDQFMERMRKILNDRKQK